MARKPSITGKKAVTIKPDRARKLIRQFHVLSKNKAIADAANDVRTSAQMDEEIAKLGGLKTYQSASISGQSSRRGGDSSKVLVDWLADDFKGSSLEVGCLQVDNACARSGKFTEHTRIDLNSQHPKILQQDFMKMKFEKPYSVISSSLVVNYVPDAETRGEMSKRTHKFSEPNGLLFFVSPRACVDNSRYCTSSTIDDIMDSIGFEKSQQHSTAKQVYWSYKRLDQGTGRSVRKHKVKDAPTMNNFAITLR